MAYTDFTLMKWMDENEDAIKKVFKMVSNLKYARGQIILAAETKEQLNEVFKKICDMTEVSNFNMDYVEFNFDDNEDIVDLKFVEEPSLNELARFNLNKNDS